MKRSQNNPKTNDKHSKFLFSSFKHKISQFVNLSSNSSAPSVEWDVQGQEWKHMAMIKDKQNPGFFFAAEALILHSVLLYLTKELQTQYVTLLKNILIKIKIEVILDEINIIMKATFKCYSNQAYIATLLQAFHYDTIKRYNK